jgi:hypothetical protein
MRVRVRGGLSELISRLCADFKMGEMHDVYDDFMIFTGPYVMIYTKCLKAWFYSLMTWILWHISFIRCHHSFNMRYVLWNMPGRYVLWCLCIWGCYVMHETNGSPMYAQYVNALDGRNSTCSARPLFGWFLLFPSFSGSGSAAPGTDRAGGSGSV